MAKRTAFFENELILYTLVGLGSTLIQYLVYSLCYYATSNYVAANILAFLISVWNSYLWNRRLVFRTRQTTAWWRVLLKTYAIYFATGVLATNLLSFLFIQRMQMSPYLSPLLIVLLLYPFNFLINKYWAHRV